MVLLRAALLTGVLLGASPVGAEELTREMVDLLRSTNCALPLERIKSVLTVMGHAATEVEAAVDGLIAAGEAGLSPDRRELVLTPRACRVQMTVPRSIAAVPWIEERLAAMPECRMQLSELVREAEAAGVKLEDFHRVVRHLSALGRYLLEGDNLELRTDLCEPGREADRPLARIEALGPDALRATLGLLAMERGCRLSLADQPALLRDLGDTATEYLNIGLDLSADAKAALELRLTEMLKNPGPAYRIDEETSEIAALYCRP